LNEKIKIEKHNQLKGEAIVPADKSISHRAVMIASISNGTTFVSNFLKSEDCLWTIDVFRKLGIEIIQKDQNSYHINSMVTILSSSRKMIYILAIQVLV